MKRVKFFLIAAAFTFAYNNALATSEPCDESQCTIVDYGGFQDTLNNWHINCLNCIAGASYEVLDCGAFGTQLNITHVTWSANCLWTDINYLVNQLVGGIIMNDPLLSSSSDVFIRNNGNCLYHYLVKYPWHLLVDLGWDYEIMVNNEIPVGGEPDYYWMKHYAPCDEACCFTQVTAGSTTNHPYETEILYMSWHNTVIPHDSICNMVPPGLQTADTVYFNAIEQEVIFSGTDISAPYSGLQCTPLCKSESFLGLPPAHGGCNPQKTDFSSILIDAESGNNIDITVYPMPFKDDFRINFENNFIFANDITLQIITIDGRTVYSKQLEVEKQTGNINITPNLPPGFSHLHIESGGETVIMPVIKNQ